MTQQTFALYTKNGYAGDLVDSGPRVVQTGILTGSGAGFGKAMSRDTAVERGVTLGSAETVFAISQREYNHEAGSRPTDGTDFAYLETESVSLIRDGYLYIELVGGAVPTGNIGTPLFVNATAGTFSGDATGTHVITTNVIAEEAGVVGDVIKCRIILA